MPGALRLRLHASGFPGSPPPIPAGAWLNFDWSDLVWASITVGRWRTDIFTHGVYSAWEAIQRSGVIYAHLREDPTGRISRSTLYADLDRSEKVAVSYYVGMAVAKLVADAQLGVAWLMHVNRYYHALRMTFVGQRRMRPDLVGPDPQLRWVVAEAKGRSGGLDRQALAKMAAQKRSVRSIAGCSPYLAIGSLAYFNQGSLAARVVDPDELTPEPVDYGFDLDLFFWAYYQPLVALFADAEPDAAGISRAVTIPDLDFRVLIDEAILNLAHRTRAEAGGLAEAIMARSSELDVRTGLHADGIGVVLGQAWASERRREGIALE